MGRRKTFPLFRERTLNSDDFTELYSMFRIELCGRSNTLVSGLLGVSKPTALKWITDPPKQWWWMNNLIFIMDELIDEILDGRKKNLKRTALLVRQEMTPYRKLLKDGTEPERAEATTGSYIRRHILRLLGEHEQLSTRMLKKPKYREDLSYEQLRRQLDQMKDELDSWTEGFGENKVTYYTLPKD